MSSCSNSECTCAEVIESANRRQSLPGALKLIKCAKDLLGPRAHGDVVRKVHPPDEAVGIDKKLGGSGNIGTFRAYLGV